MVSWHLLLGKVYKKDGFLGGRPVKGHWDRMLWPLPGSQLPLPYKAGSVKVKDAVEETPCPAVVFL